jgi:hypothetical protein
MDDSKTDITRSQENPENLAGEIQEYLYNNHSQTEEQPKPEMKAQKEQSNQILYFSINQDSK